MRVITAPLGPIGLIATIYLGLIFSNLSRRLSAVTKLKYQRSGFRASMTLLTLAVVSQVMRSSATLAPDIAPRVLLQSWFALVTFHIPFALGVTIQLILAWYHWRWIFKEKLG
jgi:hypothetical protein